MTLRVDAVPRHYEGRAFAHTYSILGYDPVTGEVGGAVQSHWFSVGSVVLWGAPGVGMVATQSFTNPSYGPDGLELLAEGVAPQEVVASLTSSDPLRESRQTAVMNSRGEAAAYTGGRCVPYCGHLMGERCTVQANMMANDRVCPAMVQAFEAAPGPLAERLVASLEAAEGAGGDFRGRQSAALLVVRPNDTGRPWVDRAVDLRVEDHHEPVRELRRLLTVHRAYQDMNEGDAALEEGRFVDAQRHYSSARKGCPENEEIMFWQAVTLAANGHVEEAVPLLVDVFDRNEEWRRALPDLVRLGHVKVSGEVLDRLIRS